MKKSVFAIILLILAMVIAILPVNAQVEEYNVKAKVIKNNGIEEVKLGNEITQKIQNVTIRFLEGEYANEEYELEYILISDTKNIISNVELNEEDSVLVQIEEIEGEIGNVNYMETINQKYYLYIIVSVIVILLILLIGKTKVIKPIIIYLIAIALLIYLVLLSIQYRWDSILMSFIISAVTTLLIFIKVNGVNKKTLYMLILSMLGGIISGVVMNILFNTMNFIDINIKITENFINIKRLFCSIAIVIGSIFSSNIILSVIYLSSVMNKQYKTKSDNIIDGQRSLKL